MSHSLSYVYSADGHQKFVFQLGFVFPDVAIGRLYGTSVCLYNLEPPIVFHEAVVWRLFPRSSSPLQPLSTELEKKKINVSVLLKAGISGRKS